MSERCVMYVDGYNFYYSIQKHSRETPIYLGWCDFGLLARLYMLPAESSLDAIKYFTAPVGRFGKKGGEGGNEEARQRTWLEAVGTISGIKVIKGYYSGDASRDSSRPDRGRKEKETDIRIAVTMVIDAAQNQFDRAILVTGDHDLIPAAYAVTKEFDKSVDVWLPPHRETWKWQAAGAYDRVQVRPITRDMLLESRLLERIEHEGRVIEAPSIWCAPAKKDANT